MLAYQLKNRLKHLLLVGQEEDGELMWSGTSQAWDVVEQQDFLFETHN